MNRFQQLNPRRVLISLLVLLILSVALLVWARDIIREAIVLPLSYVFYAIGILLDTTPQLCFWFGLVALCFYIAYRSLARRKRKPGEPGAAAVMYQSYYETSRPGPQTGRFEFWERKVGMMRMGPSAYYQTNFENALGRLLLEVLAYRHKLTPIEVEGRLRGGLLPVPDEVREFILVHTNAKPSEPDSFFAWFRGLVMNRLYAWMGTAQQRLFPRQSRRTDTPAEQRAQRILAYIEDELEVPNDTGQ